MRQRHASVVEVLKSHLRGPFKFLLHSAHWPSGWIDPPLQPFPGQLFHFGFAEFSRGDHHTVTFQIKYLPISPSPAPKTLVEARSANARFQAGAVWKRDLACSWELSRSWLMQADLNAAVGLRALTRIPNLEK